MAGCRIRFAVVAAVGLGLLPGVARADGWKAAAARAVITPARPTWMAGYASRDRPSEGAVHDLWARSLALEDPSGKKALLLTLDLCGIDRGLSLAIRDAIKARHGIPFDRIVVACSHTHSGPVVGANLITMYPMNDAQQADVRAYTAGLVATVGRVVDEALSRLQPAELAWETGRADFAVNRRNNKEADVPRSRAAGRLEGPVDHDVPVLRVRGPDGQVTALVCGYACHCTVLDTYRFCGDYAGFAQIAIERQYPHVQAMFVAGCGADQNPLPRRSLALAQRYGDQLAEAVHRVADAPMRPLADPLVSAYEEIPLRFATLPTRGQLEAQSSSPTRAVAQRARALLGVLARDGSLSPTYPYPVQVWRVGTLTWVLLGGEVVVDYALRLKRNLGSSHTWVSSYCNDVMAYIPSARVLKEGGYEGATSMIYYGQPTTWSSDVEPQIVEATMRLMASGSR
jgi:neutral ceramidase